MQLAIDRPTSTYPEIGGHHDLTPEQVQEELHRYWMAIIPALLERVVSAVVEVSS